MGYALARWPLRRVLQVARLRTADTAFILDVVIPRLQVNVVPGDTLYAGLSLKHSFLGEFPTVVGPIAYRPLCGSVLQRFQIDSLYANARVEGAK